MPSNLEHAVWIAQLLLQGVLVVALMVRAAWREFPAFALYSAFNLTAGIVMKHLAESSPKMYLLLYWASEGIAILLGLAVICEALRHFLSSHPALRKLAALSFAWTILGLCVLGVAALTAHSPLLPTGIFYRLLLAAKAGRILELGVLIFLFAFAGILGLHWRQRAFGICWGLGIYLVVELIVVSMFSVLGFAAREALSLIRMAAFTTSLLVWIGYFLAPERVFNVVKLPQRAQLEQWNRAIGELIKQ